jgi:PAS domain S-box-containing protein
MGLWAIFDWTALAIVAVSLAYVVLRPPPKPLRASLPIALGLYLVWMIGDLGTTRDLEHPHLWLTLLHGAGALEAGAAWIVAVRFAEAFARPLPWGRSPWVYVPVATSIALAAVVVTNPWHGLYLEPVPGSRSAYGPLAVVAGLHHHGVSLAILVLYGLLRWRHRSWLVRRKAGLMMLAFAAGPFFNLLYALSPSPPPFDLTVLAVIWSTSLVMVGVYRAGLFNPLPVALPEVTAADPSPVVLLDPHGYPFYANDAARELFPEEAWASDRPFLRHLSRELLRPHADTGIAPEDLERDLQDGGSEGPVYRLAGPAPLWVRVQRSPILTSRGLEVGSVVRLQDVSELMRAQIHVRASEARFRALAEHAHDLVAEVDARGRVLYMNEAHRRIFGAKRMAEAGGNALELMLPEDRKRARESLAKVLSTGDRVGGIYRIPNDDGEVRRIELVGSPFVTASGELRAAVIGRDVTDRHRADEERRLQSLDALAGGIAGDLNDLLESVLGNTSFLLEEFSHGGHSEAILGEVEAAASRAADLVARLRSYAGETPLAREPVDLSRLVEEMRPALLGAPRRRGDLDFELAPSLPVLAADPARLRQLLLTLVQNAWEALPAQGGHVRVRTKRQHVQQEDLSRLEWRGTCEPGEYVVLQVSDDGCGLDEEQRSRVFDPFFTTKGPRRGLGLATALGIARAHAGALIVQSRPERGSSFSLLLPAPD